MSANATEPKSKKMFTVEGGSGGVTAKLTARAKEALIQAAAVVSVLSLVPDLFPNAKSLSDQLDKFNTNPTAKSEIKTP